MGSVGGPWGGGLGGGFVVSVGRSVDVGGMAGGVGGEGRKRVQCDVFVMVVSVS